MKNITIQNKANLPYHKQPRLTEAVKEKLVQQAKPLFLNKDFIELIASTLKKLPVKDKLAALYFFKKVAVQVPRLPDPDFYQAFKDEIDEEMSDITEQQHYEPIKWINAEIEYLMNTSEKLTVEDVDQRLDVMIEAKRRLSKDLLTGPQVMELLGISKSTLNRRRSEGMPHYKRGKLVHYDKNEVTEWLKTEVN